MELTANRRLQETDKFEDIFTQLLKLREQIANGTVRLEGLASGTGNPLVVDANGNVFVGTDGVNGLSCSIVNPVYCSILI